MRVRCAVSSVELEGDRGTVKSVCATSSRWRHEADAFGTSTASVWRCLATLREECPIGERNFYFDEAEEAEALPRTPSPPDAPDSSTPSSCATWSCSALPTVTRRNGSSSPTPPPGPCLACSRAP